MGQGLHIPGCRRRRQPARRIRAKRRHARRPRNPARFGIVGIGGRVRVLRGFLGRMRRPRGGGRPAAPAPPEPASARFPRSFCAAARLLRTGLRSRQRGRPCVALWGFPNRVRPDHRSAALGVASPLGWLRTGLPARRPAGPSPGGHPPRIGVGAARGVCGPLEVAGTPPVRGARDGGHVVGIRTGRARVPTAAHGRSAASDVGGGGSALRPGRGRNNRPVLPGHRAGRGSRLEG